MLGAKSLGFTPAQSKAAERSWTVKFDSFSQALQQSCDANANEGIMRGSSTAFTARDMLSIAENLGEEKVNYWGFSCALPPPFPLRLGSTSSKEPIVTGTVRF